MALFNTVGDRVYIRDEHFAWLPAVVVELSIDNKVLVRIDLPKNWRQTTVTSGAAPDAKGNLKQEAAEQRWVLLKDYYNHRLPLQNGRVCRDMAELDHVHEAEILYQIKERHCIMQKPYTRVGEIIVAVNPCQWIPSLYSVEKQQFYTNNFSKAYSHHGTRCASLGSQSQLEKILLPTNSYYSFFLRLSTRDRQGMRRKKGRQHRCHCLFRNSFVGTVWDERL
jgi:hypothetical protein